MKHLSCIVHAILAMSGRVNNALDIKAGGKTAINRTIQQFFYRPINWPTLLWVFFRSQRCCTQHSYAIAGDEVVTSRAGKHTHGVDWLFSAVSIAGWQVWVQQ
jgi:putative transposase